jgi:hypothetical protein
MSQDLYNLGQRIWIESLGGLTPIQWLKEQLDLQGYYNCIDVDPASNKVTRLLYIHPTAIELWKKHPDCLLLDCTYKTNRFNMPLLKTSNVRSTPLQNSTTLQPLRLTTGKMSKKIMRWLPLKLCNHIIFHQIEALGSASAVPKGFP